MSLVVGHEFRVSEVEGADYEYGSLINSLAIEE